MERFGNFSLAHGIYAGAYMFVFLALFILVKFLPKTGRRKFEIIIATLSLLHRTPAMFYDVWVDPTYDGWIMVIPLHICTLNGYLCILSLYFSGTNFIKKYIFPIIFFGITPAIVALLNVDVLNDVFSVNSFFINHFIIIFTALYFLIYKRCRLKRNAIGYVSSVMFTHALLMLIFDLTFHANFLYLVEGTESETVANVLGVFPYFTLAFVGLGMIMLSFQYYAYFFVKDTIAFVKNTQSQKPSVA